MTIQTFMNLLLVCSVASGLITEAFKKTFPNFKGSINIVVLIISIIVGGTTTSSYYYVEGLPWDLMNILFIIIMSIATWCTSMLGYDKIKQTIMQIFNKGGDK